MATLPVGLCAFRRDEALSADRGTLQRPHVHRCERCGFITAPTSFADPALVRRRCSWFDPKVAGFQLADECWCRGLGDVIERVAEKLLPAWARERVGKLIDRIEAWLTRRERAQHPTVGCGGCQDRRVSLNRRFPLVWLRKKICPPIVYRREDRGDSIAVCLSFPHGFGDAVQFTAVLRHLKKHRPTWRISVYCKAGAHTLFGGLAERVGVMDRSELPQVYQEDFALTYGIRWFEAEDTYHDSPATKVERCLREEFGITPEPALWDYCVTHTPEQRRLAVASLDEIASRRPDGRHRVVALHYQGNSWRSSKNLDEAIAREVVDVIRAAGFTPLILDWESPPRSGILRDHVRGVRCFGPRHPLWNNLGVGDGAALHALLSQVALVVGIDSGPEHLAAATDTPGLIVWRRQTHPLNYFSPAQNLLHVIRRDQGKHLRGDRETGERFFHAHYRSHVLRSHLRLELPELVRQHLSQEHACATLS